MCVWCVCVCGKIGGQYIFQMLGFDILVDCSVTVTLLLVCLHK